MVTVKNKHITEPDAFGFQVRIVRRGKETSRYFSHKLWGSKTKSLQAAIAWRDQMLTVLKGSRTRFLKPPKNKTTTGITGVSRTIKYDHRVLGERPQIEKQNLPGRQCANHYRR
jgi:hypothetical protein